MKVLRIYKKHCIVCGKEFETSRERSKLCSDECRKIRQGELIRKHKQENRSDFYEFLNEVLSNPQKFKGYISISPDYPDFREIREAIGKRGFITHGEFISVTTWFMGGANPYFERMNGPERVEGVTHLAFNMKCEGASEELVATCRAKILVALLYNVDMPLATFLLSLFDPRKYISQGDHVVRPLRDAERIVGRTSYGVFLAACRSLAGELGVTLGELDRGLWNIYYGEMRGVKKFGPLS
ncbi:MAG: hypothetical protein ACUVXI_18380 [bacterium]